MSMVVVIKLEEDQRNLKYWSAKFLNDEKILWEFTSKVFDPTATLAGSFDPKTNAQSKHFLQMLVNRIVTELHDGKDAPPMRLLLQQGVPFELKPKQR